MTNRQKQTLHRGELLVQQRRHTPQELSEAMPSYIDTDMPLQHAQFYAGLSYLPLATLDDQGRPWASLLVTRSSDDPSIGIQLMGENQMRVSAEANPHDPFLRALRQQMASASTSRELFAGVGVDFTNRRRNKLAGEIEADAIDASGKVELTLHSDQHLGNCPKYITVRAVEHTRRDAELALDSFEELTISLPDEAKAVIDKASTTFLATRHTPETNDEAQDQRDMGLNHRGGSPGFVRLYEEVQGDTATTFLILPDHSGNRFYQSLGNIETDKQVGLVFPDFATGDMLYITGEAQNLYDEEAEAIMPRTGLITRIRVIGAVFVKTGLNLELTSEEIHSPYNPPVKYLRRELEEMGHSTQAHGSSSDALRASLVSVEHLSESVSTFAFKLPEPIEAPLPGGFGVFDFSDILDPGYSHMNEANPQAINEDYIRTWTLSNAGEYDAETSQFGPTDEISITVKRKPGGLISNFLHNAAAKSDGAGLELKFNGTGTGFSCFTLSSDGTPTVPSKMLWIAGGVGITPFMAMWDGILSLARAQGSLASDIVLMFAGRDDDIRLVEHFFKNADAPLKGISIHVMAFQSSERDDTTGLGEELANPGLLITKGRLGTANLENVADLSDSEIFMCGPDGLMAAAKLSLEALGVDASKIHHESFQF